MISRQRLTVRGIVQGVGFRPFIYRLAQELALTGWVRNDGAGVSIEAEGETAQLAALQQRLRLEAPPLAQFDSVRLEEMTPLGLSDDAFRILESPDNASGHFDAAIGPDTAICQNCLAELFDPDNRRYRYAFINCTDCGPRYTIARRLPYARAATSMAGFVQCGSCLSEYTAPAHRRFHAEPNACHACGPQLSLYDGSGQALAGDPVAETLARLRRGEIVAIKGLGGFHLACDARQPDAVARLRERKQREEKPLALMFANNASLAAYVFMTHAEAAQLEAPERPIVLLQKQASCNRAFPGIAPGVVWLGAMLPYTPLHYLLFHEAAARPSGLSWLDQPQELALVMTSANPHGEPLAIANEDALARLAGIADAYLLHDREIVTRCDDSVLRVLPGTQSPQFIRRARGFTPRAIKLARCGADVLALGGVFNNTLCFTRRERAFVSPHIGDLDHVAACLALEEAVDHLRNILEIKPQAVAHDLHPDFFSTRLALQLGEAWGVPAIAVQHHHAHIASVLAEHGVNEPVLGLALDGVGFGDDGTAWGGELLRVSGASHERFGHLRPLALPGGDRAAREPWRMAASALHMLGRGEEIATRFADQAGAGVLAQMLAGKTRSPVTTSLGRWFDAAAGLLGVQARMSFEGQAAMRLEDLAAAYGELSPPTLHEIHLDEGKSVLDLAPLLQCISTERHAGRGAALFHAGVTAALADWVEQAARLSGLRVVACGGGCFLNAILARDLRLALQERGLTMLEAHAVPPGDGGLSLGQAWVAQAKLAQY
jgi:hydrogenase maturation protein HypF